MKRLISLFLVLLMAFSFCACGAKQDKTDKTTLAPTTTEKTTTTAEKETEKETTAEVVTAEEEIKTNADYEEGLDYWFGRNGKKYDRTKALAAFSKAAKNGNADAYFWMGMITERTDDFERWDKVVKYFETAVKKGSDLGYYGLAMCYMYGKGYEQNYGKVKELAKKSIDGGGNTGNLIMGLMNYGGFGIDQNGKKAVSYFTKASKSDDWFIKNHSLLYLGHIYRSGIDSKDDTAEKPDYEKAKSYYEKAIKNEYFWAATFYANLYESSETGLKEDMDQYFKLKQQGTKDGRYYELGLCYLYGNGVKQDYQKARELFEKDLETGKEAAFDMYAIAWMYAGGYGFEKDFDEAADWCEDCIDVAGFGDNAAAANAKKMLESIKG